MPEDSERSLPDQRIKLMDTGKVLFSRSLPTVRPGDRKESVQDR